MKDERFITPTFDNVLIAMSSVLNQVYVVFADQVYRSFIVLKKIYKYTVLFYH